MKNPFNKILSFALLLTACMPVVFTLFFFLKQQAIRHTMKEKLEQGFLHTITIPAENVVWVKYKKEISIGNKLFDVKSFSIENNQYVFTGLFDEDETALNNYFEKSIDHKNERGNQLLVQLFQWLQSACPDSPADFPLITEGTHIHCNLIPSYIPFPVKIILTPPPQV